VAGRACSVVTGSVYHAPVRHWPSARIECRIRQRPGV